MSINAYKRLLTNNDLVIFLFHGVIHKNQSLVRNYLHKHIESNFFSNFLKEMSTYGQALSMDEIVWHITNQIPFPKRAFSITFDDGFENNYSIAAPILYEYRVPCTFYITSKFVDENAMSWIDQIEYCVEKTKRKEIYLPFFSNGFDISSIEKKIQLLDYIRYELKNNRENFTNRFVLMKELFDVCSISYVEKSNDILDKKMNWGQVRSLSKESLFQIGGHTHSHPILSFLSKDDLKTEIALSMTKIEAAIEQPVKHYSYPEGMENCFNEEVIAVLKNKGIICSPTAITGTNTLSSNLFLLNRVNVEG